MKQKEALNKQNRDEIKIQRPNQFGNGIIDIFKTNKIYDLNIVDCLKKGDVTCEMVNKKIIKYRTKT